MKTKSFDRVEMKRRIQQEMAQLNYARLGSVETKRRSEAWKQTSSALLAR